MPCCAVARASRIACITVGRKEFLEAGKKRLAGDTARQATSNEVNAFRAETRNLMEALAEQVSGNRLLKKSMIGDGGDQE